MRIPAAERPELERLAHRTKAGHALVQRARIIVLAAKGMGSFVVACVVGCDKRTVRKWKARFRADPRTQQNRPETPSNLSRVVRKGPVTVSCGVGVVLGTRGLSAPRSDFIYSGAGTSCAHGVEEYLPPPLFRTGTSQACWPSEVWTSVRPLDYRYQPVRMPPENSSVDRHRTEPLTEKFAVGLERCLHLTLGLLGVRHRRQDAFQRYFSCSENRFIISDFRVFVELVEDLAKHLVEK